MTATAKPKPTLYSALLAVQAEAPTLQKSAINPHFRSAYVPLDAVHEAVMPLLNKNGLVWTTLPGFTEQGNPTLRYFLVHVESGNELRGEMALLPPKSDPQGQGSAITYARRYSLMAVLGLVADEDDDGNKAAKKGSATSSSGSNGASTAQGSAPSLADQAAALEGTREFLGEDVVKRLYERFKATGKDDKAWKAKCASLKVTGTTDVTIEAGMKLDEWIERLEVAESA